MSFSIHEYTGDGSTSQFAVNFQSGYLSREDVRAFVEGEVDGLGDQIYRTLTWITDGLVNIGAAPANGLKVTIQRFTSIEQLTNDYSDGAILSATNLDSSNLQHLLVAQELKDTLPTNAALEVALGEAEAFSSAAAASAIEAQAVVDAAVGAVTVATNASASAAAASAAAASGSADAASSSAVTAQDAAALAVAVTTANGVVAATPDTLPLRTATGATKSAIALNPDEVVVLSQIGDIKLSEIVVTVTTTDSITFDLTTIPGGLAQYKQLRLVGSQLLNDGFRMFMRFNGVSTATYDLGRYGIGGVLVSSLQTSFINIGGGDNSTSDRSGDFEFIIDAPSLVRWKTFRGVQNGRSINTGTALDNCSLVGTFRNTAALSSISIHRNDVTAGMRGIYTLYGIK